MTTFAGFMLRPFLAFYLYDKLEGNLTLAAVIIGLQPLTGMISGIYSGSLSDRFGRKPMMVTALLVESISMLGYVWA
ncbi:hypothetical protein MXD81_24230, partial [Microbacteriaceae bacterium K1510]|nr:hypothetical protein [Microbacteriaceae bacterium K1510]